MSVAPARVLLVDDEPGIRFGVRDFLETRGFLVDEAQDCASAKAAFRAATPDVAIVDFALPDGDALALMPELKAIDMTAALVVLTGHASIDLAVRAVHAGAEHFLTKPVDLNALEVILRRLLEQQRNSKLLLATRSRNERYNDIDPFVGTSAAITRLKDQAQRVLAASSPVLIQGETGSGKGVLAHWLHANGARADEAFVDLNCAGLTREFVETELFGHAKGAFTGAAALKQGLLEVAHRGTVFLDEIGDMPAEVQPRLLKALEDKRFRRLGELNERSVDVKLIAASAQPLETLVEQKRFRSDLYFRLASLPLHIPPLRERREDIVPLAERLLTRLATSEHRAIGIRLDAQAREALEQYPWPGNVRELRNCLERAVLLSNQRVLGASDLHLTPVRSGRGDPASIGSGDDITLAELERRHILRVLEREGHVEAAAAKLGIPRSTLYQKLKQYRTATH